MTIIAARKTKKGIMFAGDRQATTGSRRSTDKEMEVSKVRAVNGMTIGSAGSLSQAQWFFVFAKNHAPITNCEVGVAEFMLEFHGWMRAKSNDFKNENCYLIASGDQLFRVYDEMSVYFVPEFSAIGSGTDFALAAMHLGKSAKRAAEVAATLDLYCSGDIETSLHK